ncbi:MAG: carboxymuconolactone decarboxylase family protein [Actinomycetota bacterium]|nr:carboxymuconolactone decarboxylase family protein [Actinomycetota bacterium]
MGRLARRSTAEMSDGQRELFAQMAEGRKNVSDGHIGGPFDAWGLNPGIGRRLFQAGGAIRFKPSIDRRYIELAILVTGELWQAQFEWFAHEPMARDAGVPENVIQAVKVGAEPTFDHPADEICWRFCRTLHVDRRVDHQTYADAVETFGEVGVADLVNTCGFYTLVSMTLNTFEVDLPDGAVLPFPAR